MRGRPIDAIPVPLGEKRATPRKNQRKCKVCHKALSMYNKNAYCFVHIMRGYELERNIADDKKYFSYKKHLNKMNRVNKEKKRAKLAND